MITAYRKMHAILARRTLPFLLLFLCLQTDPSPGQGRQTQRSFSLRKASLNSQLLQSQQNFSAAITLKDVPSRLFLAGDFDDESSIVWQPDVPCILKYGKTPGNRQPDNYPNELNARGTGRLRLNPAREGLTTGIYYCILASVPDPNDTSVEFKIIVQANVTPVMKSPLGRINLQDGAPLFRWDPVEGVPYYSVFLSEGPIALERDETGKITGITGLILTWQAITPATFMKYGDVDPGGNFANIHVPPLFPGVEYNWVVLNSYGPGPDLISSGVAPVAPSSFEVTRAQLSQSPALTEPVAAQVISEDQIVFKWSAVPGVSRYKIYLYESADLSGSSVEFVVWSQVTGDTQIRFDARNRLVRTDYQWRIVSETREGISTSERRSFTYEGSAGWAKFIVNSEEGPLPRASIEIKTPSEASILLPAVTDTFGVIKLPLPTGDYTFRTSKPGFVTTPKAIFSVPLDDTLNVQTMLVRGSSSISGRVVDESGSAIFDATVELKSTDQSESIRTDDTGFFSFTVNPGSWSLRGAKSGYVSSASQSLVVEDGQALDAGVLVLQTASNDVNGTVTFASDNQPLHGAIVKAQKGKLLYETTTSNQGRFRFNLEAGIWEITVDSQGFLAAPPSYSVNLGIGNVVSAPFRLFEGGIVSGTVSVAGRQLEGAILKAFDKESNELAQMAETNLQGFYTMGLRPGEYWLEATGENFLQRRKAIVVTSNQTIEENFTLSEAGFVSGTVSNQETSTPIAGAMIFVVDDPTLSAFSDNQGNYVLGLPPDESLLIDASLPGFGSVDGPFTVTTTVGETVTQSFTLKALSGILSGRITDGESPVPGAEVAIENLALTLFTDGSGAFEIEIPPGSYTVNASKDCHLPASRKIDIVAGVTNDLAIILRALQSIITGKVTDIVGAPLENAQVTATGDTTFTDSTGADGAYRLCLNSGIYQLQASQPGFLPADTTLVVSEGDSLGGVDFVLADNFAQVTGSVLDTLGNPVASANLVLSNENQTLTTSTDIAGAFGFSKIIPGLSEIKPAKESFFGEKIELFLQGQQQAQVTLVLYPADGFIKGAVRNSQDSSGIADVRISAQLSGNGDFFVTQTTSNGSYELSGLPVISGRNFDVFAFKEGFFTPAPISDVSAKTDSVDFFLVKRTGVISGVVVQDEIEQPLAGVKVEALHSSGNRNSAISDSSGRFEIQNLIPAEIYTLSATKNGFFPTTQQNIAAGDTSVFITLSRKFGFVFGKVTDVVSNAPMDNIPIKASPIGLAGKEAQGLTDTNGEYRLRLIADFYSIKPVITHHLSTPDSFQLEVTEVDTVAGIDFALEAQAVKSISVRRIDSDNPDFLNSETPRFAATARDANGTVVNIGRPIWSLNVSGRAASIDSTGSVQLALNFFGEIIVTATDPKSKKQGKVNPIPSVFAQIDSSTDVTLFDDRGLQLQIFPGAVFSRKDLTVSKTPVAPAKKGRADIFVPDSSFVLKPTNLVFNRTVKLLLPPPPNSVGQSKYIGKWDSEESVWDSLASIINEVNLIETDIGDGGEYIAIAKSKSTAIENLSLLPNPFSPMQETQGRQGLKIEFDLSSGAAPNPLFSVKIYNLEGNLVRLLHDQTPFPRGRSVIFWDGRTDNGVLARNGRYLIRLTLEDPANHKDLLKSVVLIK